MAPSSEQYAQIAALFTTGVESNAKTTIELLIPAHLPVQGGLWLVPYAGREACAGRAMLIRMHEETVDLAAIGLATTEQGESTLEDCSSFDELMERIDSPVQSWIVQPPPNTDATELLHCDADRITLLSGADQAAVVGAYRVLKGFVTSVGDIEKLPLIRLVIVGVEDRAANDAATRIVQTAKQQLGVTIEVGRPLPAMGSTSRVLSQTSFPRSNSIVDLMSRIRTSLIDQDVESDVESDVEVPLVQQETPVQHLEEEILPLDDRMTTPFVGEDQPTFNLPPEAPTEDFFEPPLESPSAPAPVETTEPKKSLEVEEKLVQHIQGLLSITPRCPQHEHVELAVDGDGLIHVLAQADDMRDAAIVSSWIVKHRELLALACGGLQIAQTHAPIQHLFTNNAVEVADLQGIGVKLHLLVDVEVDGHKGIYSTPLN